MNAPAPEKLLSLSNDRVLAYSECGDLSSKTVIIFFHGMFGIGTATPEPVLVKHGVHYVAPTLPGWGNSSSLPPSTPFHLGLAHDISALLQHLHLDADDKDVKLYISGGSFGTVPAQMLYGASYDNFPYGRRIAGVMLGAPLSPFRNHKEYSKSMPISTYVLLGMSPYVPFKLLPRMMKLAMQGKMQKLETTQAFMGETLFNKMDEAELAAFKKWREDTGKAEGEFEKSMAQNAMRSVAKTWDGFLEAPGILHSDWGFHPATLDEEHAKPILIVSSQGDDMAPVNIAEWLAANYKNSRLKVVEGGHLAILYHLEEVWEELLAFV